MSNWEQALDAQIDLFIALADKNSLAYTLAKRWPDSATGPADRIKGEKYLAERLTAYVINADPVWVEPEMMSVWLAAVGTFKPEPLLAEDLLIPTAFVLLPRPYSFLDVHGASVSVRAISWSPVSVDIRGNNGVNVEAVPGISVAFWHHNKDLDDYTIFTTEDGTTHDQRTLPTGLYLEHFEVMPWGVTPKDHERSLYRPLQAMWRLFSQTVAATSKARPGAQARKRANRVGLPDRHIIVVKLRRPRHTSVAGASAPVDWANRWIVSGHWRQQWYSSLSLHRQVWISPFVKGPDDKPLVIKRRVFDVAR